MTLSDQGVRDARTLLGFLLAPIVGVAPELVTLRGSQFDWWQLPLSSLVVGAVLGYPIAFFIGAPAYFALRRRLRPRMAYAILAGALIASVPWGVLACLLWLVNPYDRNSGALTGLVEFLAPIFVGGALGGLVFWLSAVWRDPDPNRHLASRLDRGAGAEP